MSKTQLNISLVVNLNEEVLVRIEAARQKRGDPSVREIIRAIIREALGEKSIDFGKEAWKIQIENFIRKTGMVSYREVSRKFQGVNSHNRDEILKSLEDNGMIEFSVIRSQNGVGRPSAQYRWIGASH